MSTKLYNNVKTAVLLGTLTGLILLAGALIGGQTGVIVALVLAAVMNFAGYFFSDKIALMSMQAQEVGPEHPLYGIVSRLASRGKRSSRNSYSTMVTDSIGNLGVAGTAPVPRAGLSR